MSIDQLHSHMPTSAAPTRRLAARLGRQLGPGSWLGLRGELGSGKTTFVQGLAAGLGIRAVVQSPTFVIMREYRGTAVLVHLDLYRLAAGEVDTLGLDELCERSRADEPVIVAVEWPEKLPAHLAAGLISVRLESVDQRTRRIWIG